MSALGHKRTYAAQQAMSALPPIATEKAKFRTGSRPLNPRKRLGDAFNAFATLHLAVRTVESCPSYILTYLVLLRDVFVGRLHCQKLCCFKLELLDLAAACGAPRDDVEIEPARRVGRRLIQDRVLVTRTARLNIPPPATSNLRFLIGAAANVRSLSPCAFGSFTANPKNHKIKIQMALSC